MSQVCKQTVARVRRSSLQDKFHIETGLIIHFPSYSFSHDVTIIFLNNVILVLSVFVGEYCFTCHY